VTVADVEDVEASVSGVEDRGRTREAPGDGPLVDPARPSARGRPDVLEGVTVGRGGEQVEAAVRVEDCVRRVHETPTSGATVDLAAPAPGRGPDLLVEMSAPDASFREIARQSYCSDHD